MIKINHSIPVKDLHGNSLSNTSHKWQCGDEWFTYNRNSDGYRSEDFHNTPDFLFAGCSETFGESAEFETVWAYKLFNNIKSDSDRYCNVGLPGLDISLVIHHIFNFIKKYGKPKNLFVVFPQFNRIIETNKDNTSTLILTYDPMDGREELDNIIFSNKKIINAIQSANLLQIKNFERTCEELAINLIWGTWCRESNNKVIEEGIFNNYINLINNKDIADLAINLGYNVSNLKLTRSDNNHHGEIFHEYWAKVFKEEYINRKELK